MHQSTQYGKDKLSRRTVLQAAGVSMAVPWLSAMSTSTAVAARVQKKNNGKEDAPHRFVAMSLTLGLLNQNLNPQKAGRNYQPSRYLKAIDDMRNHYTVISGSTHPGVTGGHRAEASILTANTSAPIGLGKNTISIDQLLAKHKGTTTRYPSLVVSSSSSTSPSYTDSGAMIPAIDSPSKIFMKLFVDDSPTEQKKQVARAREGRSVLDLVRSDTRKLMGELGSGDRQRLDNYFTSVRDLEKRLADSENWSQKPKPKVDYKKPDDIRDNREFIGRQKLMSDIIRLALQTDSTRYVSYYLGGGGNTVNVPGVDQGYHGLSHHGKNKEKLAQLALIETQIVATWGQFLRDLASVEEENGTLLDKTSVLLTSNLGDASSHRNNNMPVLFAGGGFKHGQHLAFDKKRNYELTKLFVSLMQRHGLEKDKFMNSTGTMRGLEMV